MGCLAIVLMLVGLVAAVIGFGPACHTFEGIQPICLARGEQLAAIGVMIAAAVSVAVIFTRRRQR